MPRETLAQLRAVISAQGELIEELKTTISVLDPTTSLKVAMTTARDLLREAFDVYDNKRPDWRDHSYTVDEICSVETAIEELSQYV